MTEQEQVDKMAQAMCGFCSEDKRCVLKYSAPCREVASQDCSAKESAEELICKGYGDVSEYKAEIERLKEKNNELNKKNWLLEEELKKKELEITYARNNGYEKGYDECEEYMKDKIKQAQVDVLNELKKKTHNYYPSIDSYCISQHVVLVRDVDKLIEEVEK